MKRRTVLLGVFLVVTTSTSAQIGKSVSVAAGTPEDKDLAAIYAAPDGPVKIRSEEHTSEPSHRSLSRMPSSA